MEGGWVDFWPRSFNAILTHNLHLRIGGGRRIERGVGSHLAAEIAGEAKADIAYEHQGCIRAAFL